MSPICEGHTTILMASSGFEKEEEKYDKVFGKRKVVAKIPKFRLDARSKVKAQSDFKF